MDQHFLDRSRKVMQLARQEAQFYNLGYVGTEHLLLGLIKEEAGLAGRILENFGLDLLTVRREIEKIYHPGIVGPINSGLPLTPRVKKAIEHAIDEARALGHH
jgi:ATP-dependent Clp protease ATP-binding subunit ClpC